MWARAAKHRGLVADEAESDRWQEERVVGLDSRCNGSHSGLSELGDCFVGVLSQQV